MIDATIGITTSVPGYPVLYWISGFIHLIPHHGFSRTGFCFPQNRILIAVGLVCIAGVLAYFLVKALLYSTEQDAGL